MGRSMVIWSSASRMPRATSSQRVMPPKMLKKIDLTCGSRVITSSASTTPCAEPPPPRSQKFAGLPPTCATTSTVDVVTFVGGRPANFCDLGGGGDAQGVVDALEVITRDPQVKAIFFNIFGGITRGDEVARGILQALGEMSIDLPIVVRLDGTNAEEGRRILSEAAPANLNVEPTMLEAAKRAVELAA